MRARARALSWGITAPSKKEALALGEIRAKLDDAGHQVVPLVADIHFTPNAAEVAADHVEDHVDALAAGRGA